MELAALITWILTAGGGFVMLAMWLSRGGMRTAQEQGNRIRPPLILGHFALAATGLVLWIVYLVTDSDALAWIAFILLLIVALLGFTMLSIWLRQRSGSNEVVAGGDPTAPEQHFPVPIVVLHGVLAAVTLVLVFLTAVGVGGS